MIADFLSSMHNTCQQSVFPFPELSFGNFDNSLFIKVIAIESETRHVGNRSIVNSFERLLMKNRLQCILILLAAAALLLCGCSDKPQIHEHTFSDEWTYNALCHWHSSTCGHDVVSGLAEHTLNAGKITEDPTCTASGVRTFTCSVCGGTITEAVPALGHVYSEEWTIDSPATCTEDGSKSRHCTRCGSSADVSVTAIPALGHSMDEGIVTKLPSLTECGYLTYTCQTCGDTVVEELDISFYEQFFTLHDGILSVKDTALLPSSLIIPESIDGENVISIGSNAFDGCTGLKEITIPAFITSIGDNAFNGWESDQTISIVYGGFTATESTWSNCSAAIEVVIPEGTTSIGDYAFYGRTGLTVITIPASVASIGNSAFHGCTGLTEFTIPASVTSIGDSAFYGCNNLDPLFFKGTMAQWNSIQKDTNWNYQVKATVVFCSDGFELL